MTKPFALLLIVFLFSGNLLADCKHDFYLLQNKNEVSLKPLRQIEIKTTKDLQKLSGAELKAALNYIEYLEFQFGKEGGYDDNSLFVTTRYYQSKTTNKATLGYKISITDGGDESNVNFYMKSDKILYRTWDNQSPERDWLCEKS